ncbi:MAG: hypothetical protein SF052_24870 [Bacteroidia bacterium]|nr:hypothetical protein [Bacteroidia bacterium]
MQQYTWFFALGQPLSSEKKKAVQHSFEQFLSQWKTHGTPVDGLVDLRYDRFVIVQADPSANRPSGCSIDSLKRGISAVLREEKLDWLDAGVVFYRDKEGLIRSVFFREIPDLVKSGELTPDSIVFDHSLDQSDDLSKWEVPLKNTWLKRYFK